MSDIKAIWEQAIAAHQRQDYETAERLYEEAAELLEAQPGADPIRVAQLWNNVGAAARGREDHEAALDAFNHAMEIHRTKVEELHRDLPIFMQNIAETLEEMGDEGDALITYNDTMDVLIALRDPETLPFKADCHMSIARLCLRAGQIDPAQHNFHMAIAIREAVLGAEHPATADALLGLGQTLQQQGDSAGAQTAFQRAARIFGRTLGPKHPLTIQATERAQGEG